MILSDKSIKKLLKSGDLVLKNMRRGAVQPCSVDLTLAPGGLIVQYWSTNGVLDMDAPAKHQKVSGKEIIIPPQSFILAATREVIKLPDHIAGFVEGRSSIGRMGLFIQNAGVAAPGFQGSLTLELYNANILPIRLKAGQKICQLVIFKMDQPAGRPYKGKYQGQKQPAASKAFLDRRRGKTRV